ncbi:hypothetical protein [Thiosulfativibrio zosterae]|uniref:Lipoprotein n=1 Tax=Thiosulfativibrio zosterae TaxID=2675053 RepID=A0A6F8PN66_9GAMM|nr:hypothetical protein [Thiosulfativibrio zosterae]BBP43484.1 hypothetical protein THMIRHAT_12300 [Thiosulfativibrio zosterae]
MKQIATLSSLVGTLAVLFLFTGCSSVQTQALQAEDGEQRFLLQDFYHEPPQALESRSLASAAEDACPKGYDILLKQASKHAQFGQDHAQCASPGGCDFVLEWRIICAEKPEKKFSIFGKY